LNIELSCHKLNLIQFNSIQDRPLASRAYNNQTRLQQHAQLTERIAAAAAELHAEKGALATSYAQIAQRAGVSLPTVYKHFPTQAQLIAACTGHVAAHGPALSAADILQAPALPAAARALVDATDRLHAHFEPWQVWREHKLVPALGDVAAHRRQQLTALIAQVVARHLPADGQRELAAVWEALLSFDLWHRLVREHKLSRAAVRRILLRLLLAACGPQRVTSSPLRPTRKAPHE
jgi:AcrR family transcriptional regulator